jgi:hypothetical protein
MAQQRRRQGLQSVAVWQSGRLLPVACSSVAVPGQAACLVLKYWLVGTHRPTSTKPSDAREQGLPSLQRRVSSVSPAMASSIVDWFALH